MKLPRDRTAVVFVALQDAHRRGPGFLAEGGDRVVAHAALRTAVPLRYTFENAADLYRSL